MGRKNKSGANKKTKDKEDVSTDIPPKQPISEGAQSIPVGTSTKSPENAATGSIRKSESDSELELLTAIGAPAELVREVKNDWMLRKKLSQIIKSSEEETAAILKNNFSYTDRPGTSSESQSNKPAGPEVVKTLCSSCQKDAETRCTGCRQVFYCSKDCQKDHWKTHKDICRPFMVLKTSNNDRILVASRDLDADDFILAETPIIIGPRQITEPICLACYRTIDGNYRCSVCTWPMCSKMCEKSIIHQPECDVTKNARVVININTFNNSPNQLYEIITVVRGLIIAGKDPKRWKSTVEKLNNRYIQFVGSQQYLHNQEILVPIIRETFKLCEHREIDSSAAAIHTMLGILQTNHVPVKTPYAEVQGLFANASLASHSCIPNTKLLWEEKSRLSLKATEMIKKGDAITINYTDMLWGTRSRIDSLKQSRLISCSCRRCKDPTELGTYFSALKCQTCTKSTPVLATNPLHEDAPWACTSCDYKIDGRDVIEINFALGSAVASALSAPSIPSLEKLLKQWLGKVHSNHYHFHAVKHSLLQLYGRTQEKLEIKDANHWDEIAKKEKYCKEFLLVCSKLDPSMGYTIPYVGLTFYEYHKTIVQNAKRNFSLAQINEQQLKKRMLLAKALLKKAMEIFKDEAEDTPEGQLFNTCREEAVDIGSWMLAVGLV